MVVTLTHVDGRHVTHVIGHVTQAGTGGGEQGERVVPLVSGGHVGVLGERTEGQGQLGTFWLQVDTLLYIDSVSV